MAVKTTTIANCDARPCPVIFETYTTQPYLELRHAGWSVTHENDEILTYCPAHPLVWCGTESHPIEAHPRRASCIAARQG